MHIYHHLLLTWITQTFSITALALRDVGLRDAEYEEIFAAAKAQGVIFIPIFITVRP
jgi:predicted nuclease of predicted toxin-antitoxin system